MGAREKNLVFCCLLLFILVLQSGLKLVDSGLTRLVAPTEPFTTIGIKYSRGFILNGPEREYSIPSLFLGSLVLEEDLICIYHGDRSISLPRYIALGELGPRKNARDVDKMPP